MLNYCIITKNKIYEEIHDAVEEEELTMSNPNHEDKIKYLIDKTIKNNKDINFYEKKCNSINDIFGEIIEELLNDNPQEESQGNTVLLYSDINEMFELVFIEKDVDFDDKELNQFASISNYELKPIYNSCAIFKTGYKNNNIKNGIISLKDIHNIMYYNFYHIGLLVDCDKNMKEITFSGDMPYNFIGSQFKMTDNFERLGFQIVTFVEEGTKLNVLSSKLCNKEISGRVFITLLNPPYNKKFGNFTKELFELIIKIIDDFDLSKNIETDVLNDKIINPFLIINKHIIS